MTLDRTGLTRVRDGSTKTSSTAAAIRPGLLMEMAGVRYAFGGGAILKDENSFGSDYTDAQWSGIKYNSFNDTTNQIFALNGTDRKRVTADGVNEWGITPSSTVPTIAVGAGTGLTGDYNVKYTYARFNGTTLITESNPSAAAIAAQTLSNQDLSVTWVASTDPQVTHVRLYRTLAGGSEFFFDQSVAIGSLQIDTSTTDVALGTTVSINHDRPPLGTVVAGPFYNGVCFIAKGHNLHYCLSKQPEYFPSTNFIEVGAPQFPILAIVELGGRVYCLTKAQIWLIQGTGQSNFLPVPMRSLTGASNLFGALAIEGSGIYHLGPDGIYLFSGSRDTKITQEAFDVLFTEINTVNGVPPVLDKVNNTWLIQFENKIYFHYTGGNVLVFNLDTNKTLYQSYGITLTAPVVDKTNERLYVGDFNNFVRQLEDPLATDDDGTGIVWEIESKDFTLQTRRHFPRFVKWDVDPKAITVTGSLLLDGVVHQTHPIVTDVRKTKRRLVKEGNGRRCSLRLSGTGPAIVYAAEME